MGSDLSADFGNSSFKISNSCFHCVFSNDFFKNFIAPILALNDIVPKKNMFKFKHQNSWFFFMEPEWYWGEEGSYKVIM